MNAKDAQRMRRLEIENRELKDALSKHFRAYSETLSDLVTLRAKLELVDLALHGDPSGAHE